MSDDNSSLDNDLRQAAWARFLQAHARLVRAIDAQLVARGRLGMDLYDLLLTLKRAPDMRLRLNELSQRVVLSPSGVSRLVDRAAGAGLVRREVVPTDRRGAFACLTRLGDLELKRTWSLYEQLVEDHFGRHVSDEEARVLERVLGRFVPPAESQPVPLKIRSGSR